MKSMRVARRPGRYAAATPPTATEPLDIVTLNATSQTHWGPKSRAFMCTDGIRKPKLNPAAILRGSPLVLPRYLCNKCIRICY